MTKLALNLLLEQDSKERPFEFTKFPILVKGTEVFKPSIEVGYPASVNPEPIFKQFRAIRRSGNWPKGLLRMPNLEHRITTCLLKALDRHDKDGPWDDVYFYMEAIDALSDAFLGCDRTHVRVLTIKEDSVKGITGLNFVRRRH
ncbi:hypothetical protein D3C79_49950 [compost metagenome]